MSYLSTPKLRAQSNYMVNVPRCATCMFYKGENEVVTLKPLCTLHKFSTTSTSICDAWVDTKGNTLYNR